MPKGIFVCGNAGRAGGGGPGAEPCGQQYPERTAGPAQAMLLVPYPLGASRGDQIENARSYQRQGLARVLMQEDMTPRTMTDALLKLLAERDEMLKALEAYPVQDGTAAVLKLIEEAQK